MTRSEHLQRCKDRALEYVGRGDVMNAFGSFTSDMRKHPETANHSAMELAAMLMLSGHLSTERQMRDWINGFN